ncbi:heterokaryon incompatibility protein-domain-containing protein [Microdochium bolleyi]|uniref:Heterokaryon incompatibility protein-domain-containing protein n=1 Tax=Microdochium bolleyi TaxID=196109 RepID=A0A136IIZ9_9PEZI|nr:heterokaryon incompatibility protein-domain-containing protein [Microdochium bolleyi]
MYAALRHPDSIRLLELTQLDTVEASLQGRLVPRRLCERPVYTALSYVWGDEICKGAITIGDESVPIGRNLCECLKELSSHTGAITIWADQLCINQTDEAEKEHQVQMMGRIYSEAELVIGWIGLSTPENQLALKAFKAVGAGLINQRSAEKSKLALRDLYDTGHFTSPADLASPGSAIWRAVTKFTQLAWFERLWIVQEACLAKALELRCGSEAIDGDTFFGGIEGFSTMVTIPPHPRLLEPYRRALVLGKIRQRILSRNPPTLHRAAHILGTWKCGNDQDRLNALLGISYRDKACPWFEPRYSVSAPEPFEDFAKRHMESNQSLEILHFAGVGDGDVFQVEMIGDEPHLHLKLPADDAPSWVPDWRVRTRPLSLTTDRADEPVAAFQATMTKPDYHLDTSSRILHVRAYEIDKISACGIPNCDRALQAMELSANDIFISWFKTAESSVAAPDMTRMFGFTLLMGGLVQAIERPQVSIPAAEIAEYFDAWAGIYLGQSLLRQEIPRSGSNGIEKATHFAYLAEEVCRNRTFLSLSVVTWVLVLSLPPL